MVNVRKGWIKIRVEADRYGNILLNPVREDIRRKCVEHLRANEDIGADVPREQDALVFLQEGFGAEEFRDSLSDQQRRDMRGGWDITILMDPWVFLHYIGYDAHEEVRI